MEVVIRTDNGTGGCHAGCLISGPGSIMHPGALHGRMCGHGQDNGKDKDQRKGVMEMRLGAIFRQVSRQMDGPRIPVLVPFHLYWQQCVPGQEMHALL